MQTRWACPAAWTAARPAPEEARDESVATRPLRRGQRYPDPALQILDPSFAKYRIYSSTLEQVATGMRWAEGPVYFPEGAYLLCSDVPNNRIMKYDERDGSFTVFRAPSNYANGNTRDRQGRLITCEHSVTRRVTRTEADGSITVLADSFAGKRLNAPNDVVVRSDGTIWFTDPLFGINGEWEGARATPEQGATHVFRLAPDGTLTPVVSDLVNPNGLAFSPDESRLYVVEGKGKPNRSIWSYEVHADGSLDPRTKLIDASDNGALDGFRVDRDGDLWCGWGSNGQLRYEPETVDGRSVYSLKGRPDDLDGVKVFNPQGKPNRLHPPARTLRQPRLRRAEAEPALHGKLALNLRALCGGARRGLAVDRDPCGNHGRAGASASVLRCFGLCVHCPAAAVGLPGSRSAAWCRSEVDARRLPCRPVSQVSVSMVSIKRAASSLVRMMLRGRERRRLARDRSVLADSGLFDPDWYRATYPEAAAAGWDPVDHYLAFGATGRSSPGPNFDAAAYLAANPDVAADGFNPLLHYIEHGRRERRPLVPQSAEVNTAEQRWVATRDAIAASGLFDPNWYLARYPELAGTGWDPLSHFTTFGVAQRTSPGPAFDTQAYLKAHPEVAATELHPLLHYLEREDGRVDEPPPRTEVDAEGSEFRERLLASGLFDPHWYAERYFGDSLPPEEALDHYVRAARTDAHSPGPYFEPQEYRRAYPEVAETGLSAIEHYLFHGLTENRRPNPFLDPAWYGKAYPDFVDTGLSPLAHFIREGDAAGRQPGPDFQAAIYLEKCPEARASGLPPLADFLTRHWGSGRLDLLKVKAAASSLEPVGFTIIVRLSPSGNLGATLESLAFQGRAPIEVILAHEPGDGVDLGLAQAHVWQTKPWSGSGGLISWPPRTFQEAVRSAQQTFIVVVDAGDFALNGALLALRDCIVSRGCDIAYGDEEYPGPNGAETLLKPGWSPELLGTYNYFGRLTAMRRCVVAEIGAHAGAAAEWALNLAASRASDRVAHVPQVLCWRANPACLDHLQPDNAPECFKAVLTDHWRAQGVEVIVRLSEDGTLIASWELPETPLVSVIIPNRDKPDLIRTIIDGLTSRTTYRAIEILIVDNGSTDPETLAFYEERSELLRIVPYDEEFNYSRACNLGAVAARGELLLFLNNDIEICDPEWLGELVRRALQPGVGVVGAKLLYPDGEIQHAGVAIGLMRLAAHIFHRSPQHRHGVFGSPDVVRNWLAVTGACHLVRRALFERIGGYDESFRIAYSDIALCLDLHTLGYRTVCTPYAPLVHHESATRGSDTPYGDQILIAKRIRAIGIDIDPFFHPHLERFSLRPHLATYDARSNAGNMKTILARFAGPAVVDGIVDPRDNGALAEAAHLDWEQLAQSFTLGSPQSSQDWGARAVLHMLRRHDDLRRRFPHALSEGSDGSFATWMRTEGLRRLGVDERFDTWAQAAFAADLARRPRNYLIHHLTLQRDEPLILLPNGSAAASRILFAAARTGVLTVEEVLWYLLEAAEQPLESLQLTWTLTPAWQEAVPDGGSAFGFAKLVRWVARTYGITQAWLYAQKVPGSIPAADQIRIAYRANADLISAFPTALDDVSDASELIEEFLNKGPRTPKLAERWLLMQNRKDLSAQITEPGVNILGHFSYPSGLRISTENLCASLNAKGYRTAMRDVPVDVAVDDLCSPVRTDMDVFDITIVHVQPEPLFPEVYARAGLSEKRTETYKIGYWYWELDEIPSSWDRAAFGCDEIWTATEFVAQGLRRRYAQPVKVLFPGLELGSFSHYDRSYFGLPPDTFIFTFVLHMTSVVERKNPIGLIRAFNRAFGPGDKAALVIKLSFGDRYPEALHSLRQLAGDRIILIDDVYSRDETLSLIEVSDAYVSLHRSEGLGLTMAEAMLLGRPVIATRYSGNLAFMTDDNSLLVDFKMTTLSHAVPPYEVGATWAEPSVHHAANQMRRLYEDREFSRNLGLHAQADLGNKLNYKRAGESLTRRLSEIQAALRVRP